MNKLARLCLLALIFGIIPHSCIAAEDDKRPPEHLCPITYAVMIDPVVAAVDRPLSPTIVIPEIARGYEEIYRRFINGKLIYNPDPKSDNGRIEFPFSALANPLEGTFDLSRCGDSGQYLSISTGYRKGKKTENANKVEIWVAPRFLIERNLAVSSAHYQPIMGGWNAAAAPVGVFWTWGNDDLEWQAYLVKNSLSEISDNNLYEHGGTAAVNNIETVSHSTSVLYMLCTIAFCLPSTRFTFHF